MTSQSTYRRGWSENETYTQRAYKRRKKDDLSERIYWHRTPHRADIKVEIAGQSVEKIVSRGEQKLIIAALYLVTSRRLLPMKVRLNRFF